MTEWSYDMLEIHILFCPAGGPLLKIKDSPRSPPPQKKKYRYSLVLLCGCSCLCTGTIYYTSVASFQSWVMEKIVRKLLTNQILEDYSYLPTALVFPFWRLELLIDAVSASEHRPRRSSGVRIAYTNPSGERHRAPSTPQQWGLPSLHRSFRRAIASIVHAAVGSV